MAIRRNFFRFDLRAVVLHDLALLLVGVRLEKTLCAVKKSFRGKRGVARRRGDKWASNAHALRMDAAITFESRAVRRVRCSAASKAAANNLGR